MSPPKVILNIIHHLHLLWWQPKGTAIMFGSSTFFLFSVFSTPNLRWRLANHHEILPHVLVVSVDPDLQMYIRNLRIPPSKVWQTKNVKISAQCQTTLWIDCKCLWSEIRYHQSENGVAHYDHSCTCILNLVDFGPQSAKNRFLISNHTKSTQWVAIMLDFVTRSCYYCCHHSFRNPILI